MPTIDPSLYLRNQQTTRTPTPDLGKDEFLKILMTQLQNQDPTSPMDDREFISQMAQFSSLEQTMNMAKSIDNLVKGQTVSPVIQYSHMIGKEVTYEVFDRKTGNKTGEETSIVKAVSQKDGIAVLELANGEKVDTDSVIQVSSGDADKGSE